MKKRYFLNSHGFSIVASSEQDVEQRAMAELGNSDSLGNLDQPAIDRRVLDEIARALAGLNLITLPGCRSDSPEISMRLTGIP